MTCKFSTDGVFLEIGALNPVIKKELTWNLLHDSPDIAGNLEIKAIKRAFLRWELVIPVKFKEVPSDKPADITITFSTTDNYFKTSPNALAYAFVGTTSQAIDLVLNDSYIWTVNIREPVNNKYNAEIVAIHEIGHVLGLQHSQEVIDVMYPVYQGLYDLSFNDINRMQAIWGKRTGFLQLISKLKGYFSRNI